jgi:hypothetical protein
MSPESQNFHKELKEDVQGLVAGKPQRKFSEYKTTICRSSPQLLVSKWFVGTPATETKKRKQREAKENKQEKKRANKPAARMSSQQNSATLGAATGTIIDFPSDSEDHSMGREGEPGQGEEIAIELYSDGEGNGETWTWSEDEHKPLTEMRPSKRAKARKSPTPSDTPEVEITAYIEVVSAPRTLKAKPTTVTRGPFFFTLDSTYFSFLSSVATCAAGGKGTPSVNAIDKAQLTWKLSVPANDRKKPLSDEDGFRALLKKVAEVIGRKKDCSVVIMLPPLSKIATNVSYVIFRPSFIIC